MFNKGIVDFNRTLNAVREQDLYLQLINDRSDKIDNTAHKGKLLNGYNKIMGLLARGMTVQQRKINGEV